MVSMRRLGIVALWLCRAQSQDFPPPAFEVADIKLNKSGQTNDDYFTIRPGGVFIAHNAKISRLFQNAFKACRDAIFGAPPWFDADRVDIIAKATPSTTDADLRSMLQTFLSGQFNVVMHSDHKTMSAFVPAVGNGGAKLQKAASDGRADCKRVGNQGEKLAALISLAAT